MLQKSYYAWFILLAIVFSSCNMNDDGSSGGGNTVIIRDNSFDPGTISTVVGRAVVWRQEGSSQHTVTSGSPTSNPGARFDSGTLNPGGGFTLTFSEVGTFPYFCRVHGAAMSGTVVVR